MLENTVSTHRILRNTFLGAALIPWILALLLLGIYEMLPATYEGGDFFTGHCISSDIVCSANRGIGTILLVLAFSGIVWIPISALSLVTSIVFAVKVSHNHLSALEGS